MIANNDVNVTQDFLTSLDYPKLVIPSLTDLIETSERIQNLELPIRKLAFALYSSEVAKQQGWQQKIAEFHLRAIFLHLKEVRL